ncbi:hypothetical protein OV208_38720 [Corallococcus sp. bb12-1]|uniref:hypothetical protein n=1 Tax=Corallococcus sp. bb12-1 TaxID=2996784 RepID=UPI00226EFA25|nr:hypothetical protein [Corallococcus sp. bb12-1]MCY1047296.1 hypothetical protein [Corallococcus sp. bb12-1]
MASSHPPPQTAAIIPYVKERLFAALAASGLFIFACVAPAMHVITVSSSSQTNERDMAGLELLAVGWMGVFALNVGWYANPLLALALFLLVLGADRGALVVGTIAAIVGASSLSWYVHPLPADESGGRDIELLYPSLGFVCWMLSLLIVPFTARELSSRLTASAPAPTPEATP